MLESLVSRLHGAIGALNLTYEIVLVNDASPDNSWEKIKQECEKDPRVKGINLSRNFGQHYAITAGLCHAKGEVIVVMDCDLQDRPEEIPRLLEKLNEGFDAVLAQRVERKDSFLKRLGSKLFYQTFSYLTDTVQDGSVANFGIYRRSVIDAILSMGDRIRYFPAMVQWVGFHQSYLPVEHAERDEGKSSYSLLKLFALAFDTIISFSNKPIRLMMHMGGYIVTLSLLLILYFFIKYLIYGVVVTGFTALILSMWFSLGFIVLLIGSVGIYVGQIFNQVKARPSFIVKDKLNLNEHE